MHNLAQIEQQLRAKFGPVKRSKGKYGIELITTCPVCGKPKLSVNPDKGVYQCWRGCMRGGLRSLIADAEYARARDLPRNIPLPKNIPSPGDLARLSEFEDDHPLTLYLENRGFDPLLLEEQYGIRYCIRGEEFAGGVFNTTGTLVVPMWMSGKFIGWQARLLYNPNDLDDRTCEAMGFKQDPDGDWIRPPKYFTSPGLDKGRALYNYDWARKSRMAVVCEGVFDAWAVGRCAVGAFGKSVSDEQANLLKAYWDMLVILLDPGDAEKEILKLVSNLSKTVPTLPVRLEGYKDAGEAPRTEIWLQIGKAAHDRGIDILAYQPLL